MQQRFRLLMAGWIPLLFVVQCTFILEYDLPMAPLISFIINLVMSAAFLHRPRAVAVDEPMVGLDPRGARLIKDVFRRMAANGVALLMSTHTLEVAQEVCHRVSIINKGQIVASGTVDEVRALAGGEDDHLTSVFLKLTGGSALQEIDEV